MKELILENSDAEETNESEEENLPGPKVSLNEFLQKIASSLVFTADGIPITEKIRPIDLQKAIDSGDLLIAIHNGEVITRALYYDDTISHRPIVKKEEPNKDTFELLFDMLVYAENGMPIPSEQRLEFRQDLSRLMNIIRQENLISHTQWWEKMGTVKREKIKEEYAEEVKISRQKIVISHNQTQIPVETQAVAQPQVVIKQESVADNTTPVSPAQEKEIVQPQVALKVEPVGERTPIFQTFPPDLSGAKIAYQQNNVFAQSTSSPELSASSSDELSDLEKNDCDLDNLIDNVASEDAYQALFAPGKKRRL